MTHQIETSRLILRPWREDDAEALYKYASNPDVGPHGGWPPHTSVDESLDVIRNLFSAPEVYAIVPKGSDEPVGCCGIVPSDEQHSSAIKHGDVELGYWIGREFWGRGFVPEAVEALITRCFDDLGVTNVWIGFYDGNDRSRRVAEKAGFTYHHTETHDDVATPAEHFYLRSK